MKKILLMLCCVIVTACQETVERSMIKTVTLIDKTQNDLKHCEQIKAKQYMDLLGYNHKRPLLSPLMTCYFREIIEMSAATAEDDIQLKHPTIVNPSEGRKELAKFAQSLKRKITGICNNEEKELSHSRIFGPLVESLELLDGDQNFLFVHSDVIEYYDQSCSFYKMDLRPQFDEENRKLIEEKYGIKLPQDLKQRNITVKIVYDPTLYRGRKKYNKQLKRYVKNDTSELHYKSAHFFERWLEEAGATVHLRSSL